MSPNPDNGLASRLGDSRVGVRGDLKVARLLLRGRPSYVVQDPLNHQTQRLGADEYRVLQAITPERSLRDVFAGLVQREVLDAEDEDTFYRFVLSLHGRNLLHLPVSDDKRLYERHRALRGARARSLLMAPFSLKLSLLDPDAFLERTVRHVRWAFTRPALWAWCAVVLTGLLVALANGRALAAPLGQVLLGQNLPLLWLTLVGLKVVHEAGHAYACKALGGRVPEIGLNLVVFTPLPFVDATSAWTFPRKRDRLIVSLAGMYVELFVASIAILVWAVTGPGLLNAAAYNAALLASVVTVAFNLNPLMKFDGYYVLSDLVEVPNLRQRASEATRDLFQHVLLGLPRRAPEGGFGLRLGLLAYGVGSAIYKVTLVLGISATIALKYYSLGLALAGLYVSLSLWKLVRSAWDLFFRSEETAHVRARAALLGAAVFVVAPAGVAMVPVPTRVVVPAVVGSAEEVVVRARRSGFLERLDARPGDALQPGDALAVLAEDTREQRDLLDARGRLAEARLRSDALLVDDPVGADREHRRAQHLEREVTLHTARAAERNVLSPSAGRLVDGLRPEDVGRWVEAGEPLATLTAGPRQLRAEFSAGQLTDVGLEFEGTVHFRARGDAGRTFEARLVHWRPMGTRQVATRALTHLEGGAIAVDPGSGEAQEPYFELEFELLPGADGAAPTLPHGASGNVALPGPREPLGRLCWRRLLRFAQKLEGGA